MANTFLTPKMIISGADALTNAQSELAKAGKKDFIVTDATMVKLGNVALLEDILKKCDIDYYIFSEVNFEPNDIVVIEGKNK